MKRISVDIGGTFTDCLLVWEDTYLELKALTTHHNLALGFMDALEQGCKQLGLDIRTVLSQVDSVRYATTLGTNTLLERKGPQVGLITTAGYESSVPLARGRGYGDGLPTNEQVNLAAAKRPDPIVPMNMITGVRERIDYKGHVVLSIDEQDVRKQVRKLIDKGAQAFVVSLMNSTVNPVHEKQIEEIIMDEYPSHMLGSIPVILSHQVVGRKGEYVRTTSAILDAYLHGQMFHALSSLEMTLKDYGYTKPMLVVHNTGGMAQLNSTHALQTIHSGPTSGIHAAEHLANEFNTGKLICMDIGGTSCDVGLVVGDGIRFYDFNPVIDRWLVSTPMTHLKIIGAGGGSIARYDQLFNVIEVGPTSAGSDPGPACYDRGGMDATVTDADLILGYLDADQYAGGAIKLNKKRAEFAIRENICEEMDLSVVEAAQQIKRKVDSNMAQAIAEELRSKGYNPKNFVLLAYGGNGALHSCGIANELEIERIFIPPFSPIFSALGAGIMNQLHIHERNVFINIYDSMTRTLLNNYEQFNTIVEELKAIGKQDLIRQGKEAKDIRFQLELDMRYGNQITETSVVSTKTHLEKIEDVFQLIEIFSKNYEGRFGKGSQSPEAGIRINTIRVLAFTESESIQFKKQNESYSKQSKPFALRSCYFVGESEPVQTPVYNADELAEGTVISGPALVESPRTTYLVEPGWEIKLGSNRAAWVTRVKSGIIQDELIGIGNESRL
ncbi:hydantoinase/oxoprolinase family protein [Neobacillus drentensis]|uniref:hydantoinase/oxoprolinase family protein n=1 Tax=Neobacillus drentensis TaxID=220684 RepID=UPI003001B996